MKYTTFKHLLLRRFREQGNVEGIGIVGSYARGEQRPGSGIDAVVFCDEPNKYLNDHSWLKLFGEANEVVQFGMRPALSSSNAKI